MNLMKRDRILMVAVAVLIFINLLLVAFIWMRPLFFLRKNLPQERAQRYFDEQLHLTDDQKHTLRELRQDYFRKKNNLERQLMIRRRKLMDEVFSANPDSVHMGQLREEMTAIQAQLENLMIDNIMQMKKQVSPEQQQYMKRMFGRMMRGPKESFNHEREGQGNEERCMPPKPDRPGRAPQRRGNS